MQRPDPKEKTKILSRPAAVPSGRMIKLVINFIFHFPEMVKKKGTVLGHSLMKAAAKTKKVRRVATQEGYLHTTDMQDGYDWGRLNLQVILILKI